MSSEDQDAKLCADLRSRYCWSGLNENATAPQKMLLAADRITTLLEENAALEKTGMDWMRRYHEALAANTNLVKGDLAQSREVIAKVREWCLRPRSPYGLRSVTVAAAKAKVLTLLPVEPGDA